MHRRSLTMPIRSLLSPPTDGLRVGPRQCGKTTLAKKLLRERRIGAYHNWDEVKFRRLWAADPSALVPKANHGAVPLVVLDRDPQGPTVEAGAEGRVRHSTRPATSRSRERPAECLLEGWRQPVQATSQFPPHPFSVTEMGSPAVLSPDAVLACLSGAGSVARRQTNVAWRTCSSMDRSRSRSSRRTRGAPPLETQSRTARHPGGLSDPSRLRKSSAASSS